MTLPLDNIKVIDFSQVMLGPAATQMLADFGADVIKIERIGRGDFEPVVRGALRTISTIPSFPRSTATSAASRMDLGNKAAKAIVFDLIATADVLVENFGQVSWTGWALVTEALSALNPRLVYASGTGFGSRGPNIHKGGQDVLAQALTGAIHRRSDPANALAVYPTAIADYAAAVHLAQAIVVALFARERDRRGPARRGVSL